MPAKGGIQGQCSEWCLDSRLRGSDDAAVRYGCDIRRFAQCGAFSSALNDAALCEIGDLARRQSEPAAVDFGIMLAELWARCRRHSVCTVKPQWRCRDDDMADLVMLDPFEHSALMHVPVVHDLADVAHRGAG